MAYTAPDAAPHAPAGAWEAYVLAEIGVRLMADILAVQPVRDLGTAVNWRLTAG